MMAGDVLGCLGSAVTTFVVCNETNGNPWINLLVSIASAVIFSILSIGGRILIGWLKKKGYISEEDAKEAQKTLKDLTDDGKLNNSASEIDKKEKD